MGKAAKLTLEYDGQKTVWEMDQFNLQQFRDVIKRYDPGDPKPKLKPGDLTMVLISFKPRLVPEECVNMIGVGEAIAMSSPEQAQAVQESRRSMIDWDKAADHVQKDLMEQVSNLPEEGSVQDPDNDKKYLQLEKEGVRFNVEEIFKNFDSASRYARTTVGQVIGNWKILEVKRRVRVFWMRLKNLNTGTVIDVDETFETWMEHGVLNTINKKAGEEGIVV